MKVNEILDKSDFSYVFKKATNQGNKNETNEIKAISNKVQMREKYIFKQKLMCYLEEKRISKEGKLVFYANMKKTWGQENYLKLRNTQNRNAIRDLRPINYR